MSKAKFGVNVLIASPRQKGISDPNNSRMHEIENTENLYLGEKLVWYIGIPIILVIELSPNEPDSSLYNLSLNLSSEQNLIISKNETHRVFDDKKLFLIYYVPKELPYYKYYDVNIKIRDNSGSKVLSSHTKIILEEPFDIKIRDIGNTNKSEIIIKNNLVYHVNNFTFSDKNGVLFSIDEVLERGMSFSKFCRLDFLTDSFEFTFDARFYKALKSGYKRNKELFKLEYYDSPRVAPVHTPIKIKGKLYRNQELATKDSIQVELYGNGMIVNGQFIFNLVFENNVANFEAEVIGEKEGCCMYPILKCNIDDQNVHLQQPDNIIFVGTNENHNISNL